MPGKKDNVEVPSVINAEVISDETIRNEMEEPVTIDELVTEMIDIDIEAEKAKIDAEEYLEFVEQIPVIESNYPLEEVEEEEYSPPVPDYQQEDFAAEFTSGAVEEQPSDAVLDVLDLLADVSSTISGTVVEHVIKDAIDEDAAANDSLELAPESDAIGDEADGTSTAVQSIIADDLEAEVGEEPTASGGYNREELMEEIVNFYQLLDMPVIEKNFEVMDDIALLEHVRLLRINNGGSFDMATYLNKAEVEYDAYLRTDLMKMRMNLLSQKGADFIATAQKIRQLIGNDFVISKTRSTEYHNMLKSATSTIVVVHEKLAQIAALLGISFTNTSLNPRGDIVPIVEGMPADPRIALATLNVLMAHIDKFNAIQQSNIQQLGRNAFKIKSLEDSKKLLEKRVEEGQAYVISLQKQYEEYTTHDCYWIIVDSKKGSILRAIDPDRKIDNADDLDLRGNLHTALQFRNKSAAKTWAQRIMLTRRFSKRQLIVKRVSVVVEE